MADEEAKVEAKVKTAVSSLGEGCLTLIAVYVGAVVVALVITLFQHQDSSTVSGVGQAESIASSQDVSVAVPNIDDYANSASTVHPEDISGADAYSPEADAALVVPPAFTPYPAPEQPASLGAGTLITQDAASSINIRELPSLSGAIQHVGYTGDAVEVLEQATNADGSIWYYIEFADTGAVGWVRGDYVHLTAPGVQPYNSSDIVIPSIYQPTPPSSL